MRQDDDGYYVATVPELPGCHSQAKSLDELMSRIKEAILLCLEEEENRDICSLYFTKPKAIPRGICWHLRM